MHNFNPRAYVRHDTVHTRNHLRYHISIHVPTWGTTSYYYTQQYCRHFNPRAYVRHDVDWFTSCKTSVFQSTCLREARQMQQHVRNVQRIFQSTCLREARLDYLQDEIDFYLFQSTCLREARHWNEASRWYDCNFNPRAYVRHDFYRYFIMQWLLYFNPRAYVRHDYNLVLNPTQYMISIHVPTWGTTQMLGANEDDFNFNPRAYVRHDEWV